MPWESEIPQVTLKLLAVVLNNTRQFEVTRFKIQTWVSCYLTCTSECVFQTKCSNDRCFASELLI
jgi:hypothetical protein